MLRRIRQHWKNYIGTSRMALIGCIILGIWIVLAIAVPLFGPWSFSEQNAGIPRRSSRLIWMIRITSPRITHVPTAIFTEAVFPRGGHRIL